jgi:hypothetical protein
VVLRTGRPQRRRQFATEAAALDVAAKAGIPVPALVGYDGDVLMLLEGLPGTSHIQREPDERRLRAIGAAAARIPCPRPRPRPQPRVARPTAPRRACPMGPFHHLPDPFTSTRE